MRDGVRGDLAARWIALGAALIAFIAAYAACAVVDAAQWNGLLAVAPVAAVLAAFGWVSRSHDTTHMMFVSMFVAFAGYAGIALERVPHLVGVFWPGVRFAELGAFALPLVLVAGIPFAFVLTVAVALPMSKLPARRITTDADDALWTFIAERNSHAAEVTPLRNGGDADQPAARTRR